MRLELGNYFLDARHSGARVWGVIIALGEKQQPPQKKIACCVYGSKMVTIDTGRALVCDRS